MMFEPYYPLQTLNLMHLQLKQHNKKVHLLYVNCHFNKPFPCILPICLVRVDKL